MKNKKVVKEQSLWKCIPENFKSNGHKWEIGKWFHMDDEVKLCKRGFHASPTILDAMIYVVPGWICRVRVKGQSDVSDDKSCHSDMMIIERRAWTKEMSVKLAIYAAELCIDNYERKYPNDDRPRKAIEAAKAWLKNPCDETENTASATWSAAWSAASATWSATSATWGAAWSAAWCAESAASATWSAASATWSTALSAALSATGCAASAAAKQKTLNKIEKKIKELCGIKNANIYKIFD
jgi:hypothetical protein